MLVTDIFKILADRHSQQLIREVAENDTVQSKGLMETKGLTKKIFYTRLQSLIALGLLKRKERMLFLTSFGKVIYETVILNAESAVNEYYQLKAIDSFRGSKDLNDDQKNELIGKLISDNEIKLILTSKSGKSNPIQTD